MLTETSLFPLSYQLGAALPEQLPALAPNAALVPDGIHALPPGPAPILPGELQQREPDAAQNHAELPHQIAAEPPADIPADVPPAPALPIRRYPTRKRRPPQRDQLYYKTDEFTFAAESLEPVCDKVTFSQAMAHKGWRDAMQEE